MRHSVLRLCIQKTGSGRSLRWSLRRVLPFFVWLLLFIAQTWLETVQLISGAYKSRFRCSAFSIANFAHNDRMTSTKATHDQYATTFEK
jgi:hypothetical protein